MAEQLYQQAAQQLIDCETAIAAEYAGDVRDPEAIETARRLYERHGPFELTWDPNWWSSTPEWYEDHSDK